MSTVYPTEHLQNGYSASAYTNGHSQPMDGRQGEYPQSGLSSPYQPYHEQRSEDSPADQASAAAYNQVADVKYNPSATPTPDFGLNPPPARAQNFPDYLPRAQYPDGTHRYHPAAAQGANAANMAQPSSPSMSLQDGQSNNHHDASDANSNLEIPVDPSISATSPPYPQTHHYSPYAATHDMHHYQTQPGMYRPEYGAPHPSSYPHGLANPYGHVQAVSHNQAMMAGTRPPGGGHPLSTVYSFVPIPGTHQQKRPRRRYEEIERMYKCGWNGCEKAYGTLNHLNAHVTMQSHGAKRTPEEFKEIRKEWKARKKEDDNQRKADDERMRHQVPQQQPPLVEGQSNTDGSQQPPPGVYAAQGRPQLPPIGYAPAAGVVAPQYGQAAAGMDVLPQYGSAQLPSYYPQSPYGQPHQMYQQQPATSNGHEEPVVAHV